MQAKRLRNAIIRHGGEAEIVEREYVGGWELSGTLNGYDVHMFLANGGEPETGGSSYYTTRRIECRGQYDPGSDYNPGGWTFCSRIKDLEWACRLTSGS